MFVSLLAGLVPIGLEEGGFAPTWGSHESAWWAVALACILAIASFSTGAYLIGSSRPRTNGVRYWVMIVFALTMSMAATFLVLIRFVSVLALLLALPYAVLLVGTGTRWVRD